MMRIMKDQRIKTWNPLKKTKIHSKHNELLLHTNKHKHKHALIFALGQLLFSL